MKTFTDSITLGYRVRLRPGAPTERRLSQWAGASRYAWNWALATYEEALDASRAEEGTTAHQHLAAKVEQSGIIYRARKSPSTNGLLYALWRAHRPDAPAWVVDKVHSHVASYTITALDKAIKRWWSAKGKRLPWRTSSERREKKLPRGRAAAGRTGRLVGPPRYRRRGANDSFTIQAKKDLGSMVRRRGLFVPMIGWIRTDRDDDPITRVPDDAVPKSITVSRIADHWEASLTVKQAHESRLVEVGPTCGIDLGVNAVATIAWSHGEIERVDPPRPMARRGVQLAVLQRRLSHSRQVRRCMSCGHEEPLGERQHRPRICRQVVNGSECGGRIRTWRSRRGMLLKVRIANLHWRISEIRRQHLHRLSDRITNEARVICTEGHHITGLVSEGVAKQLEGMRKRDRRRAMLDIGWGELRRQLAYKAEWRGRLYVETPEGAPTDAACHRCGAENKMLPTTSAYRCEGCGWEGTRQENTALACLDFGGGKFPGGDSGRPGGGPAAGRGDDAADGPSADGTRGVDSRGSGANACMNGDVPGGSNPPGEPRKRGKARKTGNRSRRSSRVKRSAAK